VCRALAQRYAFVPLLIISSAAVYLRYLQASQKLKTFQ